MGLGNDGVLSGEYFVIEFLNSVVKTIILK